jgi:hypothetical protein
VDAAGGPEPGTASPTVGGRPVVDPPPVVDHGVEVPDTDAYRGRPEDRRPENRENATRGSEKRRHGRTRRELAL